MSVIMKVREHCYNPQEKPGVSPLHAVDGAQLSTLLTYQQARTHPISDEKMAGCSNQMQVAQGQGLVRVSALVQAAIGCCILLLLVPKMVLTLCNLHWWCFSSTNQAFTNVHTYK